MRKLLFIFLLLAAPAIHAQTLDVFGGRVDSPCAANPNLPTATTFTGGTQSGTSATVTMSSTAGWVVNERVVTSGSGTALDSVAMHILPGANLPFISAVTPTTLTLTMPSANTVSGAAGTIMPAFWYGGLVTAGPEAGTSKICDPIGHWMQIQAGAVFSPTANVTGVNLQTKFGVSSNCGVVAKEEQQFSGWFMNARGEDSQSENSMANSCASSLSLPLLSGATTSYTLYAFDNAAGYSTQGTLTLCDMYSPNVDSTLPFCKAPAEGLPDVFNPAYVVYTANIWAGGNQATHPFQITQFQDDVDGVAEGAGPDFHSNPGTGNPHTNVNPAYVVVVSAPTDTVSNDHNLYSIPNNWPMGYPDPKNYTKDGGSYVPFQVSYSTAVTSGSATGTPTSLAGLYVGMSVTGSGFGTKTVSAINESAGTVTFDSNSSVTNAGLSLTYSSSLTSTEPTDCPTTSDVCTDMQDYLCGNAFSLYPNIASLVSAWGLPAGFYDSCGSDGTSVLGASLGTGDGASTTFTATLHTNTDPHSLLFLWNGTQFAGDCPQWAKNCVAASGAGQVLNNHLAPTGSTVSSGSITYSTGALTVTFTVAPPSGTVLAVNYIWGGWPRGGPGGGGKGLLDEDGSGGGSGTGIGTNGACFVSSVVASGTCAEGDYKAPNAQAQAGQDLDNYVEPYAEQYQCNARSAEWAASGVGFETWGLNTLGAWNSPPHRGWLEGVSKCAGALYISAFAAGSDPEWAAKYAFTAQHGGTLPLVQEEFIAAQQGAGGCATGGINCHATEAQKGNYWYQEMQKYLTPDTFDNKDRMAGADWWSVWACPTGCGGDVSDFALKTLTDNALDGVEDSASSVPCSAPLSAFTCGGEPAGTVSVTNGSTAVTWVSGTQFCGASCTANPRFLGVKGGHTGAQITINGTAMQVSAVVSSTSLTLGSAFTGATGTYSYFSSDNGADAIGCVTGCPNTTGWARGNHLWLEVAAPGSKPTAPIRGIIWSKEAQPNEPKGQVGTANLPEKRR